MMKKPEFFGSATVGERGQIVLPANLRKKFKIKAGDKLLVMGEENTGGVLLFKAEFIGGFIEKMDRQIQEIKEEISEHTGKNNKSDKIEKKAK